MSNLQLTSEIWKPIPNYEGYYEVSNLGRVKSLCRRFSPEEYLMNPIIIRKGYLIVALSKNNKCNRFLIHRLVAYAFIGHPIGMQINHIDGNKANNCVDNLEWVTGSQNMIHGYAMGLHDKKGSKHPCAKLTEKDILEIRGKYKRYVYKRKTLAKEYGVSEASIQAILAKTNWGHI